MLASISTLFPTEQSLHGLLIWIRPKYLGCSSALWCCWYLSLSLRVCLPLLVCSWARFRFAKRFTAHHRICRAKSLRGYDSIYELGAKEVFSKCKTAFRENWWELRPRPVTNSPTGKCHLLKFVYAEIYEWNSSLYRLLIDLMARFVFVPPINSCYWQSGLATEAQVSLPSYFLLSQFRILNERNS